MVDVLRVTADTAQSLIAGISGGIITYLYVQDNSIYGAIPLMLVIATIAIVFTVLVEWRYERRAE